MEEQVRKALLSVEIVHFSLVYVADLRFIDF